MAGPTWLSKSWLVVSSTVCHPITKGFTYLAVGNLAARGMLFLVNVLLARSLGPAQYGKVVLAQAVLMLATAVADVGTRPVTIGRIGAAAKESLEDVGAAWGGMLVLACGATVLMIALGSSLWKGTEARLVVLFALSLPAYGLSLDWLLKGRRQFGHVGASEALKAGVYLLLVWVCIKSPTDVLMVPLLYLAGWTFSVGYLTQSAKALFVLPRIRLSSDYLRRLVRAGLPVGVATLLTHLYTNAGVLFLQSFADSAAVGMYGAIFKLILVFALASAIFGETLLPTLARRYAESDQAGWRLVRFGLLAVGGGSALLSGGMFVFAEDILTLVYGRAYEGAAPALVILATAIIPLACNTVLVYALIAQGRQRSLMIGASVGCLVSAGANLALTPRIGSVGAAVAQLLTELAVAGSLLVLVRGRVSSRSSI